jgi:ADP-ribose pyrophosphatase
MRITKKEIAFEGNYLRLVKKGIETEAGREGVWETVERTNIYRRGAVVIIALTKEKEVVLERNWRAPIETFVIQFPAGLTDREIESEEETARRELLEETGYLAKELIPVVLTPLCPTLTPTEANHFLALNVEYTGNERKDSTEIIEVLKVPVGELADFLLNLPDDTKLDLRVPGVLWVLEKKQLI